MGQQQCKHMTESISLFVQLLSRYWRPIPVGYSGIILMFLIHQYPLQRINLQMMFEQFLSDVTKLIYCGSTQNPKISFSILFWVIIISCLLQRCTRHAISVISSDIKNPLHFIIGCFREIVFSFFFQKTQIRGDVKKAIPLSVVGWVCWHVLVTVQYITKAAAFVFLLSGKYGWPRTVTISVLWRRKGQLLTRYTRSMTAGFSFKYQSFYWRHVGKKQCPGNAHQIHWADSSAWPHYHLSTYWPILTAWHWEALVT